MNPSQPTPATRKKRPLISIVVPVFNEELAIAPFLREVSGYIKRENCEYEMLFVNDGSKDGTLFALLESRAADSNVCIIDLSRNFGKEAAMTAGLDHAKGDAVIVIDVDLQEPPELIPQMLQKWREGYDVVYGRRVSREADGHLKRLTAGGFYIWFNRISASKIPDDVGDFRLMDRSVIWSAP